MSRVPDRRVCLPLGSQFASVTRNPFDTSHISSQPYVKCSIAALQHDDDHDSHFHKLCDNTLNLYQAQKVHEAFDLGTQHIIALEEEDEKLRQEGIALLEKVKTLLEQKKLASQKIRKQLIAPHSPL